MASLHKDPKGRSPFWYCAFIDTEGRKHFRSTKTANRKQAEEICTAWAKTSELGRANKLTPDSARDVIARTVADMFLASTKEALPQTTIRQWCEQWLESKRIEAKASTVARYEGILQRFYTFLAERADKPIATLATTDVSGFKGHLARELSTASANLGVVTLRACFGVAHDQELLTRNPAASVHKIKTHAESRRRPFTAEEIRLLLDAAGDSEWKGIILVALYTAARLGDIATLRWNQVNLQSRELVLHVSKTGKRLPLPIVKPLADYLESLPSTDDPTAYLFPTSADAAKRTGTLSNRFYGLMVDAGLAKRRSREATANSKGRHAARQVGEISSSLLPPSPQ